MHFVLWLLLISFSEAMASSVLKLNNFHSEKTNAELLNEIKQWSLEERAGQLLMVGFRNFEQIKKIKPAGVVLFSWSLKDVGQTQSLIAQIQQFNRENKKTPMFVAIDHEGGKVLRLRNGMTVFPDAAAVGALESRAKAFDFGKRMGLELASLGINMNFAPVLDLGNARSFLENRVWGEDPKMVGSLTSSYIEGLHSARVLAVPKHFPGHGGTDKDSHFHLPVIRKSFQKLWNEDLLPFRMIAETDVVAMMTAHVQIPAIDRVPASLSENFLTKLLKNHIGFKGLIITDDLEMAGVSKSVIESPENLALRSLIAGTDMLLVVWSEQTQEKIVARIVSAVRSGELSESWLNQKVLRVYEVKKRYLPNLPENPFWRENFRREESLQLSNEISKSAPQWHLGDSKKMKFLLTTKWEEGWDVVIPFGALSRYWIAQRPQDRVLTVTARADSQQVKELNSWIEVSKKTQRPLIILTAPRASFSEDIFQLIRLNLGQLVQIKNLEKPVLWLHQGSRPVNFEIDSSVANVGIVSLYSSSFSVFQEFYNSLLQPIRPRQVSSIVRE